MKNFILALALCFIAQTAAAECTLRYFIDPLFAKEVTKQVNKALKRQGYKLLRYQDPVMEDNRLVLAFFPNPTNASFVRFYFQEFDAPNFKDLVRTEVPVAEAQKDETAVALLDKIPKCEH